MGDFRMPSNLVSTALRCVAGSYDSYGRRPSKGSEHVQKVLVGETEITTIQSYKGDVALLRAVRVVVFDFKVPKEVITLDHSMDGKATVEGDTARMAKAVPKQIGAIMTTMLWIPPAAEEKRKIE